MEVGSAWHSPDEPQSLEALRGKKRVGASSMDPIEMSPYLQQAAASFGAPQDPSAFLTLEPKSPLASQPVSPPELQSIHCFIPIAFVCLFPRF